jgi:transmembrane sensor
MESHRQIEQAAAALLAKRDSGDWNESDEEWLAQWITESTARRVAFLRLEAILERARRLEVLRA